MPTIAKIKINILLNALIFMVSTAVQAQNPNTLVPFESPQEYITKFIATPAGGLEIHTWDRYVRKFRRDHHLSVMTGWDQGTWRVGSFGTLRDEEFKSAGVDTSAQYSFHIQISGKTGYLLGTSAGYYAELRGSRTDAFTSSSLWKLPGIVTGLVYNYDPTGRFLVGAEANLTRVNSLRTRINNESEQISVSGESFEINVAWDAFIALNWGLRLQWHRRHLWIPKPQEAAGQLVDAHLSRTSQGITAGTVYHFL